MAERSPDPSRHCSCGQAGMHVGQSPLAQFLSKPQKSQDYIKVQMGLNRMLVPFPVENACQNAAVYLGDLDSTLVKVSPIRELSLQG
ncbi:hypothetical protein STEG23_029539 [Scotinomys teguina]